MKAIVLGLKLLKLPMLKPSVGDVFMEMPVMQQVPNRFGVPGEHTNSKMWVSCQHYPDICILQGSICSRMYRWIECAISLSSLDLLGVVPQQNG